MNIGGAAAGLTIAAIEATSFGSRGDEQEPIRTSRA
jgi:hypothetical protein